MRLGRFSQKGSQSHIFS